MGLFDHKDKIKDLKPDFESLGRYFAKHITSKHNQHSIIMIVGSGGTGKSYAGIDLARDIALHVAEIKGGKPEDYFNFENNLAIINKDEIKRVMKDPGKYHIIDLDDIGVGWNARKYKDDFNIFLNNIIQTFRPNNNVIIMTLQASFLIDKVPRSLLHYHIEMEKAMFDLGITEAKVFKVVLKHRIGKIYHNYIEVNNTRYVKHIFRKPPDELMREYEELRAIQLKRMNEPEPEKEKIKKLSSKDMYFDVWVNLKEKGFSLREIGRITHTDHTIVGDALKTSGLQI